jgi:hypothetical protein
MLLLALSAPLGFSGTLPATREALAEFETGATTARQCAADAKVGSHREVSRFQILPQVWRQYTRSTRYQDPEVAWNVTQKILRDREAWFRRGTGREWDYFDLYVMWNAPGEYERAGWNRARISRVVRERAERFSNLAVERSRLASARR